MKKKLIIGIVFILFCVFINVYSVEAYSGEIDPENYITVPTTIHINDDGIGEGTIYLSSSASEYNISYQKIDITESVYNSINNKGDELKEYIEENSNIKKEKEANLKTLQTEFETLYNSGTATTEQLTEAENKYNEAYEEYQEFYNTMSTNITTLQNEFLALVPDYTDSWTATTNTSNNVQLDFKNFTGKAYFILWVKIENGTNTYYNLGAYAPIIPEEEVTISKTAKSVNVDETVKLTATSSNKSTITWTSSDNSIATVDANGLVKGIKVGTVVITAKGSKKSATCTITVNSKITTEPDEDKDGEEDENIEWTDFSNAKFELKKDGTSGSIIEISNVTPKDGRDYFLFITSNNSKPNVISDVTDERIGLKFDSDNKVIKTYNSSKVAKYVELNQDLYVSIIERQSYYNEKVILYGKKLERYAEPKYSDAFFATYMANDGDQLVTTFTHSEENNRKIQIKVGKITDETILQKIKNQDSSGFSSLLSFAKSNDGIYNKTVDADKDYYTIAYNAGEVKSTGNDVINLNSVQDDVYYFLYIKADDENGKYIPQEAVTLAQASVYDNEWVMLFYGSSDFKWADFGQVSTDDTIANVELPHAGLNTIIALMGAMIIVVGAFSYIQYRKNNF